MSELAVTTGSPSSWTTISRGFEPIRNSHGLPAGRDSLARARQLLKDQLCGLTGGPCLYIGRDMKTAHGGLAITDAEWSASNKYMAMALDKSHIPLREKEEFLAMVVFAPLHR